uniref:KRAB-related domain-containing protein n=1 Tax=Sciurus vulgaris TaxID=55149 RepID=A0A8D2BA44_SCIVU
MNRDSSFSKSLREDTQKSEKKYKAFRDISKYFSKKEWAKLSHSEKITYVYLKRNYTTMTSLGLRATLPAFMSSNGQITESQSDDSDEYRNRGSQDESPESASGILQRKRQKDPGRRVVSGATGCGKGSISWHMKRLVTLRKKTDPLQGCDCPW